MKNTAKLLMLGILLMLSGCVSSLNPIYTEQDLIFDAGLLGVWTDEEATESWAFTFSDENEYKVVYTDEKGKKGEFKAHLLKTEGKTFLDLTPVRPQLSQNDFYKSHFLALHTFVQILQTSPTVQISYLEPEWLKKYLDKNPSALRHEKISGEILLTASPKELQKFLLTHLKTEGAFSKPISVKRK